MWINITNNVRGTLFVWVAIKRPTTGVLLHGGGLGEADLNWAHPVFKEKKCNRLDITSMVRS